MDVCDKSCEPMDIDLSQQSINLIKSINEPDGSPQNSKPKPGRNIKKYYIKLKKVKHNYSLIQAFTFTLILFLAITTYFIWSIKCIEDLNLLKVKESFQKHLFGQDEAAFKIVNSLSSSKSEIMFLYGGTGVGKSFAISLLLNNLVNATNVYHYTMPSFRYTYSTNIMVGCIMCKKSLVIIDNLSVEDEDIILYIKEIVKRTEDLNKIIKIMLIFNSEHVLSNFQKQLQNSFSNNLSHLYREVNIDKEFVEFKKLTTESLKKCIHEEVDGRFQIDEINENMINNFDVYSDGCKGVHKKIKYYYKTTNKEVP